MGLATFYATAFSGAGLAITATAGGMLRVDVEHSGREVEDRVADQEYPTDVIVADKRMSVTVTARDVTLGAGVALGGAKSDSSATCTGKNAGIKTLGLPGLILVSVGASQGRAEPGQSTFRFVHESADGIAVPFGGGAPA